MTDKIKEIDAILHKMNCLQSNLGADSTDHDRLICKGKQGVLLEQIKTLDPEFYKILVP